MKLATKLTLLLSLTTTFAYAQIQPGAFKHIIIVVQENRTTDNLFGAAAPITARCGQENNPTIAGADIDNGGPNNWPGASNPTCNMSLTLSGYDPQIGAAVDPDHDYNDPPQGQQPPWGWVADYDNGAMDGFCHESSQSHWNNTCPSYSYVPLGTRMETSLPISRSPRPTVSATTCSSPTRGRAFPRTSSCSPGPRRRWPPGTCKIPFTHSIL